MDILKSGAEKLGLHLGPEQLDRFEIYYRELVDWNSRLNLTSITGYDEAQVKHFLDSLTVVSAMGPSPDSSEVIDVGTGAGLPGLPVKIALSGIRLVLLEATAKKARFLKHLVDRLRLQGVEIVVGRAETVARDDRYRERFEVVFSRAVAPLPVLAELTLPFCAAGGVLIAQKKGDIDAEIRDGLPAVEVMGGRLREISRVSLEGLNDDRFLVVIDKVRATPEKYPRRPGIPTKRPIL